MKLRTSYFNSTVLKKDITRYAPVWSLYTIFLLLVFMAFGINTESPREMVAALGDTLAGMSVLNLLYAGAVTLMLFGDLFNPRMCNALHTFPMRREGWFVTHLVAGLLFCLIPNFLMTILACFTLKSAFYIAFIWLAVTFLQYLFFFGTAALSALCAGSRLGMAAVYGLINFLSLLVYYLADTFYVPLLHGIQTQFSYFSFFCPTVHMSGWTYFNYSHAPGYGLFQGVIWEQWLYLFAVAGIGVAALALTVLLYRRRQLERAGDLIAVSFLRPVFLVIATVGAGAVMHAFGALFSIATKYAFTAVGLTVGFFAGRMLLMRTVKVFQLKAFGLFALLVAALGLSMGLTRLDPLGIVTYIPKVQQVEQVTIATNPNLYYDYYRGPSVTFKDADAIADVLELHAALTTQPDTDNEIIIPQGTVPIYIEYTLKGGGTVRRHYRVDAASDLGKLLNRQLSSWQCVFAADDWQAFKSSVQRIYIDAPYNLITPNAWDELLEAMYLDCQAGNLAQDWAFHSKEEHISWVEIALHDGQSQGRYLSLNIYESCVNTIAVLEKYKETDK